MGKALTPALPQNTIPSLPRSLANTAAAVGTVQHPGQPIRFNLPVGWVLTETERATAVSLLSTLTSALNPSGPFVDSEGRTVDGAEARGALLAKLIYGLAGPAQTSDLAAASKIEMYAHAIDDLPAWSIDRAIKRWAQGSCPPEVEEKPKFAFPPSPAALRALALLELDAPKRDARMLENLLAAVPLERAMDPKPMPESGSALIPTMRKL